MPQFPNDPQVGQVVPADPHEETVYVRQVTLDLQADDCHFYAEAQTLNRVTTSARKYLLRGIISKFPIYKGAPVQVKVISRPILSYIFLEDCGWTPNRLGEPITQFDRKGTITQEPVLTLTTGEFNVHNEICVDLPPQEEKEQEDEQS
jgi:hypothetical protein